MTFAVKHDTCDLVPQGNLEGMMVAVIEEPDRACWSAVGRSGRLAGEEREKVISDHLLSR